MIGSRSLTGDDLTVDDVWAVAVDGAAVELADSARERMRAARELVERAAHGSSEHTYGVNTGFGRFVSQIDPRGADRGAPAPPAAQPRVRGRRARTRTRSCARRCCCARTRSPRATRARASETVELLVECLNRGVLPRRAEPRLGRRQRRPRAARASRAAAGRRGRGLGRGRAAARRRGARAAGLEPVRLRAKEGLSLVNGTQFMAAFGALGARPRAAARAGRGPRLRAVARGAPGLADELPAADPRAAAAARARRTRRRTCSGCSRARRSSSRTAGAARCRTPTRCAARRRCTARRATCSTTSTATVAVELNAATDNPLVLVDDGDARLERELPRPAARVRARRARDGGRRAGEHLRAARRAARRTRSSPTGCRRS